MGNEEWGMRTNQMQMSIAKLRSSFDDAVRRAVEDGERIIVKKRGKPFAALVPIADVEILEQLEDEADRKAIRKARKENAFAAFAGFAFHHQW